MLTFPRDLVFEMFLGRWVDVTALAVRRNLRQSDPVSVNWGLPTEQGKALAPPSTAEGVLNNDGGHWTSGNPLSDWYDYLQGRNVLTRLALRVSRDTFTGRTSASDWLTSDTGDGWSFATSGSGSVAVGSGVGTHTQPNTNAFVITYLGDSYPDCQIAISGSWNMNVAGGSIEPLNLVLRYQPSGTFAGEHYLLRVEVTPAEVLNLTIHHSTLGAISPTVAIATLTPGANNLRAKFQIEGQALRGKIYAAGPSNDPDVAEPLGWAVSAHHERLSGGFPGVRTGVASGNTNVPVTISYDDWDCRLAQHTGELTKIQPTWDESHKIKKAAFKCADITQRLGSPKRPALSSAPRRYLAEGKNSDFTATDFWPLDEAANAPAQGLNTTAGGDPARFLRETGVVPNRGAVKWGESDRAHAAIPAFPTLSNGGRLAFTINQTSLGSVSSIMWAMRLSPDAGAQVFISTASTVNRYVFFLYTDGTYELFSNPSGTSLATGVLAPNGLDGFWSTLGLTVFNNGGASNGYHLNVNGTTLGVGTFGGDPAYSPFREMVFHVPQATTGGQVDSAVSTVFVTSVRFDTVTGGKSIGYRSHWAIMGWRGECSGLRAFRLAAEEGVPFDYYGDLGQTRVMGPQRPEPLLDQLEECAEADGALLFAPRYGLGVAFRPRRALCVQTATATLSYSSGHVSGVVMAADDRPTANYVKAEKIDGGFRIVEQAVGPMNTKNPDALPIDPEAVGKTPADAKVNVESEAQLGDVGGWVRALGTVPEVRFPRVTVDLANRELTKGVDPTRPAREVAALKPGDRLLVTGMASADVYRDLDQLVRGGRTTITDAYQHQVVLNTAPYEKYKSGVFGEPTHRFDGPGQVTTIDAQLLAGVTGGRAVTTSAGMPWTTSAAAFTTDFFVLVGGEVIRLSGITGTGLAAQTMTIVARAVNGVAKTHAAGTRVYLYQPCYYQ